MNASDLILFCSILLPAVLAENGLGFSGTPTSSKELAAHGHESAARLQAAEQFAQEEDVTCMLQTLLRPSERKRRSTGHEANPWHVLSKVGKAIVDLTHKVIEPVDQASNTTSDVVGTVDNVTEKVANVVDVVAGVIGIFDKDAGEKVEKVKNVVDTIADDVDIANNVTEAVTSVVDKVSHTATQVAGTVGVVTDTIDTLSAPPVLEGNSVTTINHFLVILVVAVLVVFLLTTLLETCCTSLTPLPGRPSLSLCTLLLLSYAILAPGLVTNLFSLRIVASLVGLQFPLTTEGATANGTLMKSTFGLIKLLLDTDCIPGAVLLMAYALVIPVLKLILLAVGEAYRFSDVSSNRIAAQYCIRTVQIISKWACPDMFVYILLLYLFRTFANGSSLIDAQARLDIGFTCFSGFCLLSTVLSFAIQLPQSAKANTEDISLYARWWHLCLSKCCVGPKGVCLITLLAFAYFAYAMYCGTLHPCMGLHLNSSALSRPGGPVPALAAPIVAELHLDDKVKSEVSLRDCITKLVCWAWEEKEGTCIVGLIMIAVFVVAFTCLDMIMLLLASLQMCYSVYPSRALAACEILGHISMLDVCLMGVVVVCLVGDMYEDYGVIFSFRPGIWLLLQAELLHYLVYYVVTGCSDINLKSAERRTLDSRNGVMWYYKGNSLGS